MTPQTFQPRASSVGLVGFALGLPLWERDALPPTLVDMCCGCGALGIALFLAAPRPFRALRLLDASADAVVCAEANRLRYAVPGTAERWEAGEPLAGPALIVCNPPYLPVPLAHGLPAWERDCVAAPEGGLAVVRRCLRSIAARGQHLILKSLAAQVPQIERLEENRLRLAAMQLAGDGVAFSFWEPARC